MVATLQVTVVEPVSATGSGSGYRLRLPAPDYNIFITQILVKRAVLKTKVNNLVFF